jgi:hypothetical protein
VHRCQIEATKMVEFQPVGVTQHRFQIGSRIIAAGGKADEVLIAAAIRNLYQTKPVTRRDQPHGFRIYCKWSGALQDTIRQIAFVEENAHAIVIFVCVLAMAWFSA